MNSLTPFGEIRRQAAERRDRAISTAREEYAATLARIAALEQDLLGREPSSHRSLASCIDSVIPTDRTFTTVDILAGLEGIDPRRTWRKRSIDSHIQRLRAKGILRRLDKARAHQPAQYARVGVQVERRPFEGMTLAEVVREVLAMRPMRQTELVLAMLDAGYRTAMSKKRLRDAVGVVLRKDQRRFRRTTGIWQMV
jgi:hypothetical protein